MNWKEKQFYLSRRNRTLCLVQQNVNGLKIIYDMGDVSPMRYELERDYFVKTLPYKDYNDLNMDSFRNEVFVSFKVFEHIFSPYHFLKATQPLLLICTVPLKIPFVPIHWSKDKRDRHYHEFEEKQFLWMLEEAGYEIIYKKKWWYNRLPIGIRTLLRYIFPSWLAVVARRKN